MAVAKISNWSEYNKSLCDRGKISLWLDEETIEHWYEQDYEGQGAPRLYSNRAIECCLMIRSVFSLPLRATKGLLEDLCRALGYSVVVPHYSTFCRRAKSLSTDITDVIDLNGMDHDGLDLAIDSTGLKVYGEGEWKVRAHGVSKRRTWRKLHLLVDVETNSIVGAELTTNSCHDSEVVKELVDGIEEVSSLAADGAYDSKAVFEYLEEREIEPLIRVRENAKIRQHGNRADSPMARDEIIRKVRNEGLAQWKEDSGYSMRSLAETAMYRFKVIFNDKLRSRHFEIQKTEAELKVKILNVFTELGMPEYA